MRKALIFLLLIFIIFMITNCEYFKQLTEQELLEIGGINDSPDFGLTIINPTNNMTVAGTKTILAVATSESLSKIELYIDGIYINETIENEYEYSWNTIPEADGNHTIRFRAFDALNNMQEKMITVNINNSAGVDITAPSAGISFPANSSNIIGNTLLISNCTDASGINKVCFYVNSAYAGYISTGTGRYWLNTGNYTNGSKTIMIRAFDNAGNMGTASITATVSNVNNDKNYMQSVPNETFTIGWSGLSNNTASVTVSAFYMGKYEITQGFWNTVYTWATSHSYLFNRGSFGSSNYYNYPVWQINWYDAVKFCNALSEMNGLTPCYYTDTGFTAVYRSGNVDISNTMVNWNANGYRLPAEAEWECAARYIDGTTWRAGDKYSGSDIADEVAWYEENTGGTVQQTVGLKNPNQLNIYDMTGNQWEWCWDWYTANYTAGTDPIGPTTGTERTIRGGCAIVSLLFYSDYLKVSHRKLVVPSDDDGTYGFRIVRKP
ncbi:MAG: SUMF1/EgtB/PvdO family nonheme iron enzyme [Spirochaetes bacterium]|nr:SUMF1/EgtB/PvdO family nonheme iron enzyme [Spirochaetota bacterium]